MNISCNLPIDNYLLLVNKAFNCFFTVQNIHLHLKVYFLIFLFQSYDRYYKVLPKMYINISKTQKKKHQGHDLSVIIGNYGPGCGPKSALKTVNMIL